MFSKVAYNQSSCQKQYATLCALLLQHSCAREGLCYAAIEAVDELLSGQTSFNGWLLFGSVATGVSARSEFIRCVYTCKSCSREPFSLCSSSISLLTK